MVSYRRRICRDLPLLGHCSIALIALALAAGHVSLGVAAEYSVTDLAFINNYSATYDNLTKPWVSMCGRLDCGWKIR
jgi:hypothetical protein